MLEVRSWKLEVGSRKTVVRRQKEEDDCLTASEGREDG